MQLTVFVQRANVLFFQWWLLYACPMVLFNRLYYEIKSRNTIQLQNSWAVFLLPPSIRLCGINTEHYPSRINSKQTLRIFL